MWRLEAKGGLTHANVAREAPEDEIAGDAPLPDAETLGARTVIRFGGTQDGRGFSLARRLRSRGYRGQLVAAGPLEPDQARHAFQCGFDVVSIEDATLERHGRDAWENALRRSVTDLYLTDPTSRLDGPGLWASRHRAA